MSNTRRIASQITFLYFQDLSIAQRFYEQVIGLELVEDQGWARIYRVAERAFLGIVDERYGSRKVKEDSAVVFTLVVDDVLSWYQYLEVNGVKVVREPAVSEALQVQSCFVEDPGGYLIELQRFLRPEVAAAFGLSRLLPE